MDPLKLNTVKEFGAYFTVWFDWDIDEKRFWLSGLFLPLFVKKKWHKKPMYQNYNLSISPPIAKYYHFKTSPQPYNKDNHDLPCLQTYKGEEGGEARK